MNQYEMLQSGMRDVEDIVCSLDSQKVLNYYNIGIGTGATGTSCIIYSKKELSELTLNKIREALKIR